jgi:hypothetical protein
MIIGSPSFRVGIQLIMQEGSDELEKVWLIEFCRERSNSTCSFYQYKSVGYKEKGQITEYLRATFANSVQARTVGSSTAPS